MRRTVTATCLVLSTVITIWMYSDPHAPLYAVLNDYTAKGIVAQLMIAAGFICFSFGIGRMFKGG